MSPPSANKDTENASISFFLMSAEKTIYVGGKQDNGPLAKLIKSRIVGDNTSYTVEIKRGVYINDDTIEFRLKCRPS